MKKFIIFIIITLVALNSCTKKKQISMIPQGDTTNLSFCSQSYPRKTVRAYTYTFQAFAPVSVII